jgi:hypothetical protein
MTPAQARALKIYCESATMNNGYIPKTFEEIANILREEGYHGSSSSVQRWCTKFDFKSHLTAQIQLAVIEDKDKTLETVALRTIDTKKAVDIIRNNELTSDGYEVLENFVDNVLERLDKKEAVSLKEIQLVKDIVLLTSGREDKLLDRLAGAGNETLSSEEILKEFETIDIDIEEE